MYSSTATFSYYYLASLILFFFLHHHIIESGGVTTPSSATTLTETLSGISIHAQGKNYNHVLLEEQCFNYLLLTTLTLSINCYISLLYTVP